MNKSEILKALETINEQLWAVALDDSNDIVTIQLFQDLASIFAQVERYYDNRRVDKSQVDQKMTAITKRLLLYADLSQDKIRD